MPIDFLALRRRLALLMAASGCGLPALAGSPLDSPEQTPLPIAEAPAPLIAVADTAVPPPIVFDEPKPAAAPAPVTPSQNVTINLINRLVERGVLPKEDAVELIKQAEKDAQFAKAQAAGAQVAPPPAVTSEEAVQYRPPLFPDAQVVPAPAPEDALEVTYIPEVVKAQMRDEITAEVLKQTREDRLEAPANVPGWVKKFRVAGDIRVRYEGDFFPDGNDNTGAFPNFNSINTGAPFDVSGTVFSPQLNVDQDRQRFRIRARLAAEVEMGEGFTAGIRIATGENNSPVTTNQSLGLANQGQGGNFSKYAIWLDRAFLKYEFMSQSPVEQLVAVPPPAGKEVASKEIVAPNAPRFSPSWSIAATVGRFENPFFYTNVIWDDDLGFDGIAVQAKYQVTRSLRPFLTLGAFPVFNTDFNFSSNQPAKFDSYDKYLYGAQIGTDWVISKDLTAKFGVAYYYFQNIEGELSDPYTPLNAQDAGNTDNSRPSFAQKGNTYRALRNIVPDASNNFGTTNQFQYFGLATPFRDLALTGRLIYSRFEPVTISVSGEYIRNLAFDGGAINAVAVNNRGPNLATGEIGSYDGGDTAWNVNFTVGHAALEKRWDWLLSAGYRYIESDAVVDGFNDSDFGLGGTNLKGYTIGGAVALSSNVWLDVSWLSADSIAGPPYKSDVILFDINGKF